MSRRLSSLLFGIHPSARTGRAALGGAVSDREPLEVCPPAPGRLAACRPIGLRAWLRSCWRDSTGFSSTATPHRTQHRPEQPATPFAAVRADFTAELVGENGPAAAALLGRIMVARSARELWHLRVDVYTVVARLHGEAEARARLGRLNRHFATRSAADRSVSDPFAAL